ncbi:pitrilysin family protein [Chroococcus sp. FPU101]|uniref:M16 family metallopeptidase n=1 Tax=Chroococcus sp. FPU101 TaxID=1974212 RepID=UPI001AA23898|nr:pitrilysin family protein [Chroococcus sp. FPU101]GFE71824.1 peptidase M16 domain protein [Chroococcus sp. FPU101]
MIQLSERLAKQEFPARVWQLEQGLTVIYHHLPVAAATVVDVWVKAGAVTEPQNWSGIAHFLEHMIFKGTKRIPPGIFDQEIEYRGGVTNAATSHDYAHFFLTIANSQVSEALPYLAEILLQAEIPDEEFYRERDVVLEEIRSCQDDPDWIGFQTLCESIYQCHPYGRSILGDEARLMQLSPNQMRCFHRTYYQPKNMTVVIVGGISETEALQAVRQSFANFSTPSECPVSAIEAEPPMIGIRRSQLYLPRLETSRLTMAWNGPGVEQLEDAFGLDLISAILTGGRSSNLVRNLREEQQLVLDIDSCFSLQRDSSLFTLSAWLDSEHLDKVEDLICQEILQLQTNLIKDEQLNRCKRILLNDYIFSTETPGQIAGLYGYYQTIAQVELSFTYPKVIQNLQASDVQRLASQYFSAERYAITIMQPTS